MTDYQEAFSAAICGMAEEMPDFAVVATAAEENPGLKRFRHEYPERFFDESHAGVHAAAAAAALAGDGLVPVLTLSSSSLPVFCDRILCDVCRQGAHVVFAVDRTGLVRSDGEFCHGIFTWSFLSVLPGMTVMAPKDDWELAQMLRYAVKECDGPVAVCYPDGETYDGCGQMHAPIRSGKSEILYDEEGIALIAVGGMIKTAQRARAILRETGFSCSLINARFVKPADEQMIIKAAKEHVMIVTLEENVRSGSFGDHVLEVINDIGARVRVLNITLPDSDIAPGDPDTLRKESGIDAEAVCTRIIAEYVGMRKE